MARIGLRICIELRFCLDPQANPAAVDGVATGIAALVQDQGWSYEANQRAWDEFSVLERFLLSDSGRLSGVRYTQLLQSYLDAQRHGFVIDNPHWDVVVTGARLGGPGAADGDQPCHWVTCGGRPAGTQASAVLVLATGDMDRLRPGVANRQGLLAGYQAGTFLLETDRCDSPGCLYNQGANAPDRLAALLQAFDESGRLPACARHAARVPPAPDLETRPSPLSRRR